MRLKSLLKVWPVLCGAILVSSLAGCPKPAPNVVVSLLVSPTTLAFGAQTDTLFIDISKSYSSRPMAPFQISANQEWLSFSPTTGVSTGPQDRIRVAVTVDRSLMTAGQNAARITIGAEGIVPVEVTVTATQLLVADFSASDLFPFSGEEIQFFDESIFAPGTGPITSWEWDFGDDTTSTDQNPLKVYATPGSYDVTLTTTTAQAESTVTKTNFIVVAEPQPPVADFTASTMSAFVGQQVQFTDTSSPGSLPITSYLWDFGDGTMSTLQNPVKVYSSAGTYTVALTVMTGFGSDTETKTDFITVTVSDSPIPDFTAAPRDVLVGDDVRFTDQSIPGSLPILSRTWMFGDGATAATANPTHQYNTADTYDVSLTINTAIETETETKADYVTVRPLTALDRYVRKADNTTDFDVQSSTPSAGVVTHLVDFVSQTWRSAADIYRIYDQQTRQWRHKLTIIEPTLNARKQVSTSAFILVDGGSNDDGFPDEMELASLRAIAATTNSVVAQLSQVPNQPIFFTDRMNEGLTEDEIIAYTFDRFLDNPADEEWPLLLPMVKSVVRAMDEIQFFMDNQRDVQIDNFFVTGASKRGWTTWLTAASDPQKRVIGLAPVVIDILDFEPQLRRHFQSYNEFSPAVMDYVDENVFSRLTTAQGQQLIDIVDPYSYRERLTQPKYIINATGDEFFLPDASEFYFSDLLGVKRLLYVPNSGHGVSAATITPPLLSFYTSVAAGAPLPEVNFTYEAPQRVRVTTSTTPSSVMLYQSLDSTPTYRDFRQSFNREITPVWNATPLNPVGANEYLAEVTVPGSGWRGYYVQVTFNSAFGQYAFCTELRIVPQTLPFPPPF